MASNKVLHPEYAVRFLLCGSLIRDTLSPEVIRMMNQSALFLLSFLGCATFEGLSDTGAGGQHGPGQAYYVDSVDGNDDQPGSVEQPWKTLDAVSSRTFKAGDRILFKRDTSYSGCVTIRGDGTEAAPIIIGAYGTGAAPRLTNPDHAVSTGNAMRIRGDHHIVEDLYFHHTAPARPNVASFEEVWAVGALHVGLGSDHVIIRNNEFANVPKAIQSYSEHSLITGNDIHDANDTQQNGFLSEPYWGPIGIQLGIGNQEVSHNTIENMYVQGGEYGADGGAIEIDDGRHHKDNISIHHNTTHHNMGFVEISYWDDIDMMASSHVSIAHNISRDFQSFVLWWAPTTASIVQNNTIIRDDQLEGPMSTVFVLDEPPGDILFRENIVVVDDDQTHSIFSEGLNGAVDDIQREDNCYWNVDEDDIGLGLPALGPGEIQADPSFIDYDEGDYRLQANSPAIGWGAVP